MGETVLSSRSAHLGGRVNEVQTKGTVCDADRHSDRSSSGFSLSTPLTQPSFSRSNRYHEWAAYFNDSWKVRPRLTVNLGVRYEYYGTQHNANQALDSNFYPGPGNTRQEQIANGRIQLAQDSAIGKLWAVDKNNFAPRLGIAWDVFGDSVCSRAILSGPVNFRGSVNHDAVGVKETPNRYNYIDLG